MVEKTNSLYLLALLAMSDYHLDPKETSKIIKISKELGKLITEATVYLECWMRGKDLKKLIAKKNSRKAFFSEYK